MRLGISRGIGCDERQIVGVSCEKCHGPGERHAARERSPIGRYLAVGSAIVNPASWAAYLTSVTFIVTLMIFLEGTGGASRKFGIFLALIFSIVALVLTVLHWREER